MTAANVIPIKHWEKGRLFQRMVPWEKMGEHSSLMWSRGKGHLDIAFGESAEAKRLSKNMAMIRGMDHKAISMIWNAAESWVREDTGSLDMKEVARRVDDVVRRTQPTFETIDRPELARNPNLRVASMFSSVINKNHALKFMNDVEAYEKIQRGEFTPEAKREWAAKSVLNRVLTPGVFAAVKTAASIGFLTDLFAEDENTFVTRFANKFANASIGEMGIISSKIGQAIQYIASQESKLVTGNEQNMPGTRELEDIGRGLIDVGKMIARGEEDFGAIKTNAQIEKEKESDRKAIQRLIRGSLSLGGKGYQNVYDIGNFAYKTATKEEKSEL
jgi:hypothetical protein